MVYSRLRYEFEIREGHIVQIRHHRKAGDELWNIYLENIFWGGRIAFPMTVDREAKDRLLWMYDLTGEEFATTGEYRVKGPASGVVSVYANRENKTLYFIMFTTHEQMLRRFVHYSHKKESVAFRKDMFRLCFSGCLYSAKRTDIEVRGVTLVIDRNHRMALPVCLRKEKRGYTRVRKEVPLSSIVGQETEINNPIHIEAECADGTVLRFNIGHKNKRKKPTKYYYLPIISTYYQDHALFVRGNVNQNYTLVVRPMEEIEKTKEFQEKEAPRNSRRAYWRGRLSRRPGRKPVNLYFEKDSMKAEEGTWEIFQEALSSAHSENYFILDRRSPQWEALSGHPGVVERYSEEYYRLLYRADHLISTETSSHLNVHRSLNYYVRRALIEKQLIFLQHGITYLKCQGAGSVFGKGKEGEPTYIAVCSEKEKKAVCRMLHIPKKRCMLTGLPVFSTIAYEHIGEESENYAAILFTWRPSEEHLLAHFADSTYYRKVVEVYTILRRQLAEEHILIVPHPKVLPLLMETDLRERIDRGAISETLKKTKLLITDYSSTCYNAFYQGAAVVFYQPDLEAFEQEVGRLVPKEEEYIGERVFTKKALEEVLRRGIREGQIALPVLRSEEYRRRYEEINAFHDGKNVERIVEFLRERSVL